MAQFIQLPAPKVLNPATVARIADANEAIRQLRRLGCKVKRLVWGSPDKKTEIVIDRNPHCTLMGCDSVHVICEVGK